MKTLIILHGWQSSKEKWQKVKANIEQSGVKVIVPDLPGFKPENELKKALSLDDYVDWVKNFAIENISGKFFLLGHSFGGRIAIKFAAKYPEKLEGLILVSAAGIKRKKTFWQILLLRIAKIGKKFSFLPFYSFFKKIFYKFILRKTDYLKAKGLMKETFKKIIEENLTPYLSKISLPTLIIWGARDKVTPIKNAYLIKKEIENSTLKLIPEAGHTPYLETPEKLAELISKFLSF